MCVSVCVYVCVYKVHCVNVCIHMYIPVPLFPILLATHDHLQAFGFAAMILFLVDVLGAFLSLREHRKGKRFISEAASVKTARNPQIGEQSVCMILLCMNADVCLYVYCVRT